MQRRLILIVCLAVAVLLFLVVCLGVHLMAESTIHKKIAEKLVLSPGGQIYDAWIEPPAPVYIEFYLFNLTNQDDVFNRGAKPKLKQVGPFTYRERRLKTNVKFSEDGTYVDYRQELYYVFDRKKSILPEDTWFIGVNLPMLTVANMLEQQLSWGKKLALNMMLTLQGVHLFNNYTAKEFLWGYSDPFFTSAKGWLKQFGKDEIADRIPDKVGLFTGPKANGSNDGLWRVNTGKEDINKFNQIISWNKNTSVNFWNTEWANMINGTDASMWHPFIERDEELFMFAGDICRSGSVKFNGEVVHKGLNLYRFTVNKMMMADNNTYPPNSDFCTPPGNCLKGGVLNMSVCMQGAPIIMSLPHFYGADPDYINGVDGMIPDEGMQTKLDIDPVTGAVLHAVKYLQFNAYIAPLETFPDTLEMNTTVYPILWVRENGGITDEGAYYFKKAVYGPLGYVNTVIYILLGLGAGCFVVELILITKHVTRGPSGQKKKGLKKGTDTPMRSKVVLNNANYISNDLSRPGCTVGLLEKDHEDNN